MHSKMITDDEMELEYGCNPQPQKSEAQLFYDKLIPVLERLRDSHIKMINCLRDLESCLESLKAIFESKNKESS
jgi:hypothetical protein